MAPMARMTQRTQMARMAQMQGGLPLIMLIGIHAKISRITVPETSVKRKSRPP
jgi:hypothetical protein